MKTIVLSRRYQFYFMVKLKKNFTKDNFIESFETVGDASNDLSYLCKVYNTIPLLSELKSANIAFFRAEVEPLREDIHNKNAKFQRYFAQRDNIQDLFRFLFLYTVDSNEINGIYLKIIENVKYEVEIWWNHEILDDVSQLLEKFGAQNKKLR